MCPGIGWLALYCRTARFERAIQVVQASQNKPQIAIGRIQVGIQTQRFAQRLARLRKALQAVTGDTKTVMLKRLVGACRQRATEIIDTPRVLTEPERDHAQHI
jgi:hypothetical protein